MWIHSQTKFGHKEPESPWFNYLYVHYGPLGGRVCPTEPRVWHPPTDVYETDAQITVKVDLAGVDEDAITVQLEGRELSIRGCRQDPAEKLAYQQMEISYGEFRADVHLPCEVDEERAHAYYEGGFLYVDLPKADAEHTVPVVTLIRKEPRS